MEEIIKAFHGRPIIRLKKTNYVVNPLLDHFPETHYKLLNDTINELGKMTDFKKANKIVAEEDRGGYIAAILAYKKKKSLGMVKWNPVYLKGQISVNFRNSYTRGKMYLYGVKKGDRVILVEDLVDSGGTIIAMIKLLKKAKVIIQDVICLAEKEEMNGAARIEKETGLKIKFLLKFNCLGKKSKVIEVNGKKY